MAQSHGRLAELEPDNAELKARIEDLNADDGELRACIKQSQRQAESKTPQNSSLPLEHAASAR